MYHHKQLFMQWHESDDEFFINVVASQQIHNAIMVVLERLRDLPSNTFQVQTAVLITEWVPYPDWQNEIKIFQSICVRYSNLHTSRHLEDGNLLHAADSRWTI